MTLEQLRAHLDELNVRALAISNLVKAENRRMNDDEGKELDAIAVDFEKTEKDIQRLEGLEANALRLTQQGSRRKTAPLDGEDDDSDGDDRGGYQSRNVNSQITVNYGWERDKGKLGFASIGEYGLHVARAASKTNPTIDPRIKHLMGAEPEQFGGENSDLGVAVPPDFREQIMKKVDSPDSLAGRVRSINVTGKTITEIVSEETAWGTDGIQVYFGSEGKLKRQSTPDIEAITSNLDKIYALVPMSDEILEDAGQLESHISEMAPEKMDFAISLAILQGEGSKMFDGVVNGPATISVAAEGGQAADTVVYNNINKMWARLSPQCRMNAIWIVDCDVEEQMQNFAFPTSGGTTAVPAYMPPGGLADTPYGRLKGRPVIAHEAANQLGDKGDIILMDPTKYNLYRRTAGPQAATSMHLWFDYDLTAFRIVYRVAGKSAWKKPIEKRQGGRQQSCFVTLDERA